jgi:acyl-homoserine lactone synthase
LLTFNEHTLEVVRNRRAHHAPVLSRGYPDMLGRLEAS